MYMTSKGDSSLAATDEPTGGMHHGNRIEGTKMSEGNIEKVQKVVEMTGVSYADAKDALEQAGWDVLSAVISLEEQGKTERRSASYSTRPPADASAMSEEMRATQSQWDRETRQTAFSESACSFGRRLRDFLLIRLYVEHDGRQVAIVPMFLVIAILVLFRCIALVAVIVSLFFGVRYRFEGLDAVTIDVNGTMDKVADIADSIAHDEETNAAPTPEEDRSATGWEPTACEVADDDGTV